MEFRRSTLKDHARSESDNTFWGFMYLLYFLFSSRVLNTFLVNVINILLLTVNVYVHGQCFFCAL